MLKKLLLVFVFTSSILFSVSAQTRFKFSSWNAISLSGGEDKDFYYLALGGILDKRFKINHELRTGLFYKSMEYSFSKTDYNFRDFLLQEHPGLKPEQFDSIAECRISFGYLSIPLGYNYYLGPRSYLSYNLNINISMNNARYACADSSSADIIKGTMSNNMVQGVFIDHEIAFTFIVLRRLEFFTGVSWNINSNLLKSDSPYEFVQEFGKNSSKYSMMRLGLNIYTFQFKRKKL